MKNKKGFTLVELIGVVILIGLIALIAIPSVDYIITKTKNNAYNRTKDTLKDGLRNWVTDNKELIYEDGEEIIVTLADLKEQGYIEYEIKNPKTSTCLANTMQFKITRVKDTEKDTYEYTFLDEELLDGNLKDCEAVSKTPSIYLLGDNPQKIEITNDSTLTYASFDPGATAKSSAGEDMSSGIVKSNNVDLKVLGKDYHAKYTIIENGISKTLTRKVYVVDTTAPELNVPEDLEIGIGETLNLMEGVTATDNSGVAPTIKTSGSINYNRPGEYVITYIATDKSGNSVSKDRTIKVISKYSYLETYEAGKLADGFRSSTYFDYIISISFMDNANIPANALAVWDLSEAKDNSIKGWVVESTSNTGYYNMYIGSNGEIRANQNSSYWFSGFRNLYEISFDNFVTSDVTDMSHMFHGTHYISSLDLRNWDVSNVTDMSYMFTGDEFYFWNMSVQTDMNSKPSTLDKIEQNNNADFMVAEMYEHCSNIQEINFEGWNTSNVTDMSYMFENVCFMTNLDLSDFDTENVTDMSYMFHGMDNILDLNISSFDTSSVTNMSGMFYLTSTHYLNSSSELENLDLSSFNTENVTDMSRMFYGATSLKNFNVSHFNTNNVTNMSYMFYMVYGATNLDLSAWNVSNVTNMSYMFGKMTRLTGVNFTGWNTSSVTSMEGMFLGTNSLTTIDVGEFETNSLTNISKMFSSTGLRTVILDGFDTKNVTNMSGLFMNTSITSIDFDNLNTTSAGGMSSMFESASISRFNLKNLNTSNVKGMSRMFYKATGLSTLDVSLWDTSQVTDMSYMFYEASTTTLDLTGLDTQNVTNMKYMFAYADIDNLKISTFNTANVKFMDHMFYLNESSSLDLSNFNTQSVTDMSYMFYKTKYLSTINLLNFNTQNVTNMSYMFAYTGLTSLNLSNFNTQNVTDMSNMFDEATQLTTINLSNFNTSNVTNMRYMFADTTNLTSLDLRHFNTSNVKIMNYMFTNSGISTLNVSGWNVTGLTNAIYMFSGVQNLTTLDLSSWNASSLRYISNMFNGATNLKTIKAPKNILSTANISDITSYDFTGSDGNTYAAGTFPLAKTTSITLTR